MVRRVLPLRNAYQGIAPMVFVAIAGASERVKRAPQPKKAVASMEYVVPLPMIRIPTKNAGGVHATVKASASNTMASRVRAKRSVCPTIA